MKHKGRIRVGADADITVFDPERVIDTATFEKGLSFSAGIEHVVVNAFPRQGSTRELCRAALMYATDRNSAHSGTS